MIPIKGAPIPTIADTQAAAREMLSIIGADVAERRQIVHTDTDETGLHETVYAVNPNQFEYACDQHRLVTGNPISAARLMEALHWF